MPLTSSNISTTGGAAQAPAMRVPEGVRDQVAEGNVTQAQVVINEAARKGLENPRQIEIRGELFRLKQNSIWFTSNQTEAFMELYNELEAMAGEWVTL